jgi:hypothetical protein
MKYELEIYLPGGKGYDVVDLISSEAPFLPITRGDIINPKTLGAQATLNLAQVLERFRHGCVLRVTGIEHFIVQVEGRVTRHRLGVFTEAIEDVDESRP